MEEVPVTVESREESQAEEVRPKVEPVMVALPDSSVLRFLSRTPPQLRRVRINKAISPTPTLTTMVRQVPEASCKLALDCRAPVIPVGYKM